MTYKSNSFLKQLQRGEKMTVFCIAEFIHSCLAILRQSNNLRAHICIAHYRSQSVFTYLVEVSAFSLTHFWIRTSTGLSGGLAEKVGGRYNYTGAQGGLFQNKEVKNPGSRFYLSSYSLGKQIPIFDLENTNRLPLWNRENKALWSRYEFTNSRCCIFTAPAKMEVNEYCLITIAGRVSRKDLRQEPASPQTWADPPPFVSRPEPAGALRASQLLH